MATAPGKITTTGKMKWPGDDSDMAKRMLEMFVDGTFDPSDFSVTGVFKHRFEDDFSFSDVISLDQFKYHVKKFVTLAICEAGGTGGFFNLFLICYFFYFPILIRIINILKCQRQ